MELNELESLKNEKVKAEEEISTELKKKKAHEIYNDKEEKFGETFGELERIVMLKVVDEKWMDHIDNMDELKMVLDFVHMVKKTQ